MTGSIREPINTGHLILGAPSLGRSWILPLWFEHIDRAIPAGFTYETVLLLPENDLKSIKIAEQNRCSVILKEPEEIRDVRQWDVDAFVKMAGLRNVLLDWVLDRSPSFYFSIDTDILIHPSSLQSMIGAYNQRDCAAVGGLSFLTTSTDMGVNGGYWNSHLHDSFRRAPWGYSGYVDVIMAFKMMDLDAFSVRYSPHRCGEDAGWSLNMSDSGFKIWFDTSYASKHVRQINDLQTFDSRCGY